MNSFILIGFVLLLPLMLYRALSTIFNWDTPGAMFQLTGSLFLMGLCLCFYGFIREDENSEVIQDGTK
jgi:hypothetical protein